MPLSFTPLGDAAVLVKLGERIDRDVNEQVHALARAIKAAPPRAMTDVVPAYASLAIHYDPARAEYNEIVVEARAIIDSGAPSSEVPTGGLMVGIPTRYDGPDLDAVAVATGLSVDEIVERHTAREYLVYMVGFAPGFAYLGELDEDLQIPRRASPRTRVPAGSVAIAGAQTAIYPAQTPGGWHLIGRTDLVMFDPSRKRPSVLAAGDKVQFVKVAR